jgi:hypothetical protein
MRWKPAPDMPFQSIAPSDQCVAGQKNQLIACSTIAQSRHPTYSLSNKRTDRCALSQDP